MMNRKKFYLIIVIILATFLVTVYLFSRGRLRFAGEQGSDIKDITQVKYSIDVQGCLNLTSNIKGAKASISSNENSFSEVVDLPSRKCVPVGKYLLSIYARDYRTSQSDIVVSENQDVTIKTSLEPIGSSEDEESVIY